MQFVTRSRALSWALSSILALMVLPAASIAADPSTAGITSTAPQSATPISE